MKSGNKLIRVPYAFAQLISPNPWNVFILLLNHYPQISETVLSFCSIIIPKSRKQCYPFYPGIPDIFSILLHQEKHACFYQWD